MPVWRDSFWRGHQFTSQPQMQAEAERSSLEVTGQRQCRLLDSAAPVPVFTTFHRVASQQPLRGR